MARKKLESGGGPGSGDWLNTYADMVTLLLTFFILLFSMSSIDATKFNLIVEAFASSTGQSATIILNGTVEGDGQLGVEPQGSENALESLTQPTPETLQEVYEALSELITETNLSESVSVSQGDGYVFIQFMNDMLFEPNSAVLKPSDREILEFVGKSIKSIQNKVEMISVHGHTAAIPDNPDYAVNDWMLSSDRADAVVVFFDDVIKINPSKMQAITWGKNKPLPNASNNTEEGRAKNRRVEILISQENLLSEQLDNVYEKLVE